MLRVHPVLHKAGHVCDCLNGWSPVSRECALYPAPVRDRGTSTGPADSVEVPSFGAAQGSPEYCGDVGRQRVGASGGPDCRSKAPAMRRHKVLLRGRRWHLTAIHYAAGRQVARGDRQFRLSPCKNLSGSGSRCFQRVGDSPVQGVPTGPMSRRAGGRVARRRSSRL